MGKPGEELKNVARGSDPLQIVSAVKHNSISQSTPVADANNTLFIDISFNVPKPLGEEQYITVSGLSGARISASVPLHSLLGSSAFCTMHDAFERGLASWVKATHTLLIVVCADVQLSANTSYRVSFDLQNPEAGQDSPSGITIAGTGAVNFPPELLNKPNRPLFGVPNGKNPLEVVYWFLTRQIGQSTPLASKRNTISVTIQTNIDIPVGGAISMTGLYGATVQNPVMLSGFAGGDGAASSSLQAGNTLFCNADNLHAAEWNSAGAGLVTPQLATLNPKT